MNSLPRMQKSVSRVRISSSTTRRGCPAVKKPSNESTKSTMAKATTNISTQGLGDNQVAVLDFTTRQFTIVTFDGHYPDDVELKLHDLGRTTCQTILYDMKDIIEVIVELSRMQGQAIDRAQAGLINTAIESDDKWQTEKQQDNG